MKVGILTTHPIQYQVPWFRLLAKTPGIDLTVFFCMIPDAAQQGEGFGVPFQWDVPLVNGYPYRLLKNVSRKPSATTFFGCDTPEVARVVRNEGFDAFIVNGWVAKSCLQLLAACTRYNVPCIVRGESNDIRPRARWKRLVHRQLMKRFSAFLCIGESNRRFYIANGVPPGKLYSAPYCVDNEWFESAASESGPSRDEIRDALGIPREAVVFLFSGKFIDKKRPMDCIDGLRIATEITSARTAEVSGSTPPEIHLLMVGSGDLLANCRAVADRDHLPITFAGFLNQSELPRAYAAADCLVLPSDDGETWGLVVNDAMVCGLPAIVSDRVGCQPDLVIPSVTGKVFPLGDVSALGELMAALAQDPHRLVSMGEAARDRVRSYNYDEVVRGTMAALSAVCGPEISKGGAR